MIFAPNLIDIGKHCYDDHLILACDLELGTAVHELFMLNKHVFVCPSSVLSQDLISLIVRSAEKKWRCSRILY